MRLVNSKLSTIMFVPQNTSDLPGSCERTLNLLFASEGGKTSTFQPLWEAAERWIRLKLLTPANSRQKYEPWSVQMHSAAGLCMHFSFLCSFSLFWPCAVAAPYWVLFCILLFLQSYASHDFIQTALNSLIHLTVYQPSAYLTAGIDSKTPLLLNYPAYLAIAQDFSPQNCLLVPGCGSCRVCQALQDSKCSVHLLA